MGMSDDLKYYLNISKTYTSISRDALSTMRSARTYASLNEAVAFLYNDILKMNNRCEKITRRIMELREEEAEEIEEPDNCEIIAALNNLGDSMLRFSKCASMYTEIYKELNGETEVISAKKTTKVNKAGKTVDKD